jgi:hypothetical protein
MNATVNRLPHKPGVSGGEHAADLLRGCGLQSATNATPHAIGNSIDLIWQRGEHIADARELIVFIVELINAAQCDPNTNTDKLLKLAEKVEAHQWDR